MRVGNMVLTAAAATILAGFVVAAEPAKKEAAAAPPMDPQKMMEAYQKAATPGPEHAVLKNYEGKWKSHVESTMDPTQPAEVSDGTSEGTLALGGRFVTVVHHGTMMGQEFEGRMLLGYDNVAKKYTSAWVDNFGTMIVLYDGHYDAAKKTLNMAGHFTDPLTGKAVQTKGVTTFVDANTMTYDEYFPGPDGKEVHTLHINFKRA